MSFLENNFFLLAITFGIFFFAKLLQKKTGLVLLNPILLTIALLIIFLKMTNISYETYNKGGHLIEFWLRPAVVALGVPLYLQLEMIKKQLLPILLSQLAGCIVGVISVVLIAKFMGASQEVILSLAYPSVSTGRLHCRSYFSSADCEIHGSFPRSNPVFGSQIGYDSDCDGSNQSHWRYSVTDGGSCCGSRFIRSDLWF